MLFVNDKDLVVPGELLSDEGFYPGRGTYKENTNVVSSLLGLVSLRNKKISVIPLKSKYIPKRGDVVIGEVSDIRFSMWDVDINSPYSGMLQASEVFGREKKPLDSVFKLGDVLFLRVIDVDEVKKVKLGLKGRGLGKFKEGIIVKISPTKVPRLIGKKGSMINMIKDKTNCDMVVGQNGVVWVKGEPDMERIVERTIKYIEKNAHTSGLTDNIRNRLIHWIDGEPLIEESPFSEEAIDSSEELVSEESFDSSEGITGEETTDIPEDDSSFKETTDSVDISNLNSIKSDINEESDDESESEKDYDFSFKEKSFFNNSSLNKTKTFHVGKNRPNKKVNKIPSQGNDSNKASFGISETEEISSPTVNVKKFPIKDSSPMGFYFKKANKDNKSDDV